MLRTEDQAAVRAVLDVSQLMVDCLVESLLTLDETSGRLAAPYGLYCRLAVPYMKDNTQEAPDGKYCRHGVAAYDEI